MVFDNCRALGPSCDQWLGPWVDVIWSAPSLLEDVGLTLGTDPANWYQSVIENAGEAVDQWFDNQQQKHSTRNSMDHANWMDMVRRACILAEEGQTSRQEPTELAQRDACLQTIRAMEPTLRAVQGMLRQADHEIAAAASTADTTIPLRAMSLAQQTVMLKRLAEDAREIKYCLSHGRATEGRINEFIQALATGNSPEAWTDGRSQPMVAWLNTAADHLQALLHESGSEYDLALYQRCLPALVASVRLRGVIEFGHREIVHVVALQQEDQEDQSSTDTACCTSLRGEVPLRSEMARLLQPDELQVHFADAKTDEDAKQIMILSAIVY
eukprot:TRINITY_DN11010_c0_g1_i2.p2 TRINITY_DN11010_c0_g1~~TRINITY_DN11010_c0_g1_i2.p2  ORF type:complete len:327 (+),score=46.71 TRINITY_DN11010_c0_g1_i2:2866-3846(+)